MPAPFEHTHQHPVEFLPIAAQFARPPRRCLLAEARYFEWAVSAITGRITKRAFRAYRHEMALRDRLQTREPRRDATH